MSLEYTVVHAGDFPELSAQVEKLAASGWKPQGGIAAYTVMEGRPDTGQWYSIWYMQAMVKEEPK